VDESHLPDILTRAKRALTQAGLDDDELQQFLAGTARSARPSNDWEWQNEQRTRLLELLRIQ
jgi:hypothetical protein